MLVEVVELRQGGVKLEPHVIKAATPLRGLLRVDLARGHGRDQRNAPLVASLWDIGLPQCLLEPLRMARVTKVVRGGMLIIGIQQHVRQIRVTEDFRQAWWARPVTW